MSEPIVEVAVSADRWRKHCTILDRVWGGLTPVEIATEYGLTLGLHLTVDDRGQLHEQCNLHDLYVEALVAMLEIGVKAQNAEPGRRITTIGIKYVGEQVSGLKFTFNQ